ncbi:hypothetical protein PVAND_010239 [Polypedilum vanderplanki]|uniref:Aminopeptidase N n=1 Tax=Polypedilum vanderplanki TaxID=319348 RepID=A0A9J6CG28_POLVA|nr:hypothetical protein PVAND_010239 [Polypedilum vanderplanki]
MKRWKSVLIFLVIVVITVINCAPHTTSADDDTDYRLPKLVVPLTYDLTLNTDIHNDGHRSYDGIVKIEVNVVENTNRIVLHSRELNINNAIIKDSDGQSIGVVNFEFDTTRDFLFLTFSNELQANSNYTIEIVFNGQLKTGTAGFYRSQYQLANETVFRYIAGTQFEPTRARSAFPCFDEPEYKATFELTITHGSKYHALSNTEGTESDNGDGTITTKFNVTPKMSVYLLAFVVSDFTYNSQGSNPTHRIFSRPDHSIQNRIPNAFNSYVFLNFMQEYFNFSYELSKMDSVAMPDHGSAMENWGLIIYKEQYLISEVNPHPYQNYDVVGTISHELAHQFFGNVVTCKWWTQIWLNEGFATWLEFILPEKFEHTKNMRFFDLFNIRKTHVALRYDSLNSTRPMTNNIEKVVTPADISNQFDTIAYDKAGAIIRQFEHAIGSEMFKLAMSHYLIVNKNQPVTSDNLLEAIEISMNIAGHELRFNFTHAFRTWEMQAGYPLVTVRFDETTSLFRLTQKRYLSSTEETFDDDSSWYIPLSYTTGANPDFDNYLFTDFFPDGQTEKTISTAGISGFDASQWYIFNLQQLGYYRVNYDENNWRRIIEVLNSDDYTKIHVLNRAQLVDDALTLAFDGVISYDIALGVVSYLARETDYMPWYPAVYAFDKLDYILKGSEIYEDFQRLVRLLIRKLYLLNDFTKVNNLPSIIEQSAMELAIDWTCRMGDQKCLSHAYQEMKAENFSKPLEITYICNGMKGPNRADEFKRHFDRFQNSIYQTERLRIIDGLLCPNDPQLLKELLYTTTGTGTFYRSHEKRRIYTGMIERSSVGLKVLIDYILEYYNEIVSAFEAEDDFIDSLLISASKRISTSDDENTIFTTIDQLEAKNQLKSSTRVTVTKNIKFNKDWVSSELSNQFSIYVHNYFKSFRDFEGLLRLPKVAEPIHYDLHLDVRNVHKGELPYTGKVSINVRIIQETDKILLHSKDHEIHDLKVVRKDTNEEIKILEYNQNSEVDTLAIYFFDLFTIGTEITITVDYSTQLLTEIDGFYRDSYIEFDENQQAIVKYLATTQFQAVEARRCFPSFDEPEYRAVFDVKITHDQTYSAVSNMPDIAKISNDDGTITTHFNSTPPMSTYLLAFLVSDFKYLSNENTLEPGQTMQRIWTRPGIEEKAKYGLENSINLLEALEEFVDMKFDLPKLDSGAIPGKGGGMENWGLVLYREVALVYEENDADISHNLRQRGVRLIAHEIAHMFFGDLVTAQWWNYLWLNEGFATYVMYYISDMVHPDWRMREFYSRNVMLSYALVTDASTSTRSMSSELITVDDINNSFDDITYDKASCVLRMFHYAVGDELFRSALHDYLTENKYKSVTSQHLINAIELRMQLSGFNDFPFEIAFRSWENQEGVPFINVHYDTNTNSFHVTQERFFDDKTRNVDDKSSWYIPINYATATKVDFLDTKFTHYFANDTETLEIIDTEHNSLDWYIFNKQQIGYYRVNYDENNWKALITALKDDDFDKIHILNRMQIIDDAFALANAGYIVYDIPYEIIMYLLHETDFFAWDIAMVHIEELYDVFGPKDEILNQFILKLSEHFYNQYEIVDVNLIDDDAMPIRYARELAINIACRAGNEKCWSDTFNYGTVSTLLGIQKIARGLDYPVLCNYFKQSNDDAALQTVYNEMIKMYQPFEESYKSDLMRALACTKNSDFLYNFLERSLGSQSNNINYTQSERRTIFNAVLGNENGIAAAFKLLENFQNSDIVDIYGWSWQRVLNNIASSVYTSIEQYLFLEKINTLSHPLITQEHKYAAIRVLDENLNNQRLAKNVKQMDYISMLLEREFGIITTIPPTTTSSTTTSSTTTSSTTTSSTTTLTESTTTTTTNLPPTTTVTTTTKGATASLSISIFTFILTLILLKL